MNETIRKEAEALLAQGYLPDNQLDEEMWENLSELFHEVRVHQVELEMQNQQLRETQTELEVARRKYFDLYDLAPTGYLTLDQHGNIIELNRVAATLLGASQSKFIIKSLTRYLSPQSSDTFYLHQQKLRQSQPPTYQSHFQPHPEAESQTCELTLGSYREDGVPIQIQLESRARFDDTGRFKGLHSIVIDITDRKLTEEALRQSEIQTKTLYLISRGLNAVNNELDILRILAQPALKNQASQVYLFYAELNDAAEPIWMKLVAAFNHLTDVVITPDMHFRLGDDATSELWLANPDQPFYLIAPQNDDRLSDASKQLYRQLGIGSEVKIPLYQAGRWVGLLRLIWSKKHRFSEAEQAIYDALPALAAPAVENRRNYLAQQNARQRAEIVAQVSAAMSTATDEQQILATVTEAIQQYQVSFLTLNYVHVNEAEQPYALETVALQSGTGKSLPLDSLPMSYLWWREFSFLQQIGVNPEQPRFIEDVSTDLAATDYVRHFFSSANISALIALPLKSGNRWQGIMTFNWQSHQFFGAEMRQLLTTLQPKIADIVAARRAYLAEQEARQLNEQLYQISRGLNSAQNEREILQVLAQPAQAHGAHKGYILYIEVGELGYPMWAEVVIAWQAGPTEPTLPIGSRFYLPNFPTIKSWFAYPDQIQFVVDVMADKRLDDNVRQLSRQQQVQAFVFIPLHQAERWTGAVLFQWREPHNFSQTEQAIYNAFPALASPVLENRRLVDNLEHIVAERTSELTIFRAFVENAADGIVMTDFEGHIEYANPAYYNFYGYDPDSQALTGLSVVRVWSDQDHHVREEMARQAISEGIAGTVEVCQVRRNGSHFDASLTMFPIFDADNRVIRVAAIVRDITERRRMEAALQRSQAILNETQKIAQVGGWEFDLETNLVTWTEEVYHIYELPLDAELSLEQSISFYVSRYIPPVEQAIDLAIKAGQPFDLEVEIVTAEWNHRWVRLIGQALRHQGRVVKLTGSFQDITKRKQAELHLETMYQISRDLNVCRNAEELLEVMARPAFHHGAFEAILAYVKVETTGKWQSLEIVAVKGLTDDDSPEMRRQLQEVQQSVAEVLFTQTNDLLCLSNTQTDDRLTSQLQDQLAQLNIQAQVLIPLQQSHQWLGLVTFNWSAPHTFKATETRIYGAFMSLAASEVENQRILQVQLKTNQHLQQEIAERKQAEKALAEAKNVAEAASRAKSEFLANISHELRTPLNGILGYVQILKRDKLLTSHQRDGMNIIQQSSEHLLTLINDILDLSKIEAGRMEIHPTEFHLCRFLESLTNVIRVRAEQKGITFCYQPATDLPTGVLGDEKRLRQVLINLLGNAIKFTSAGQVTFSVNQQENQLNFIVQDTGIGMSEEQIAQIFQPFQQVGDSWRTTEGTGLGLSISKRLVEAMDGQLQVASQPNVGSTFSVMVELPIVDGWQDVTKHDTPLIVGYVSQSPIKLLLVDDKVENRLVIRDWLVPLGFEVFEASNGLEALTILTEVKPVVILMDLIMPVMSGLEATRQIRQRRELGGQMVIIATSASAFEDDRRRSQEAGCDDFISKPIDLEQLLDRLKEHLKLTWVYEQPVHVEREPDSADLVSVSQVAPPPEQAKIIFELARRGHIKEIREQIDYLERMGEQYQSLVDKLRQLAKLYQVKQIRQLLEPYVK